MQTSAAGVGPPGPTDSTRRWVETGTGASLSVIERPGDPALPAFLLVHGLASNARLWDGVGARLAGMGHASVAVDQRGHGRSDPGDGRFDFAALVDDLADVIGATLARPVVAVGQSWGGNVVLELAARRNDLVQALALVDGGFLTLSARFAGWEEAERLLAPPDLTSFTAVELEAEMRARLKGWPEEGIRGQLANFEILPDGRVRPHLDRGSHMEILRHLWEHRPDEIAAVVRCPTLVLAVGDGSPDKVDRVAGFASRLAGAEVRWETGHHDIHAQMPDLVVEYLIELAAGST